MLVCIIISFQLFFCCVVFIRVQNKFSFQIFLNIDADSHVYQLLLAKLQMGDPRDFDSQLYMCTEAFDYMDLETVNRLCESGLLLVYGIGILIYCISTLRLFLSNASVVAENSEAEKFFKSIHERHFEASDMTSEIFLYNNYGDLEERTKIIDQDGEDFPNMTFDEEGYSSHIRKKDAAEQGGCDASPHSLTDQVIQGRSDLVFYVGKHHVPSNFCLILTPRAQSIFGFLF